MGVVTQVIETGRGAWYEVKDKNTGALVRLRAASMEMV